MRRSPICSELSVPSVEWFLLHHNIYRAAAVRFLEGELTHNHLVAPNNRHVVTELSIGHVKNAPSVALTGQHYQNANLF